MYEIFASSEQENLCTALDNKETEYYTEVENAI